MFLKCASVNGMPDTAQLTCQHSPVAWHSRQPRKQRRGLNPESSDCAPIAGDPKIVTKIDKTYTMPSNYRQLGWSKPIVKLQTDNCIKMMSDSRAISTAAAAILSQ